MVEFPNSNPISKRCTSWIWQEYGVSFQWEMAAWYQDSKCMSCPSTDERSSIIKSCHHHRGGAVVGRSPRMIETRPQQTKVVTLKHMVSVSEPSRCKCRGSSKTTFNMNVRSQRKCSTLGTLKNTSIDGGVKQD